MIDKLKEIITHFESLENQMADPVLTNNQNRYVEVTKEHRYLSPIIEKAREFIKTQEKIDDDLEILNSDDVELIEIAQAEIEELQGDLTKLEKELKVLLLPHDPTDDKNTIIEVRAGTGGDEAALFAADLYRMYSRFAERNGWEYEVLESSAIGIGGYKEIIFSVTGNSVYGIMKFESGVHRVQRVPATESSGRIHTSAATVAVLPEAEEVDIEVNQEDLQIDIYHASGHGGQNVQKVATAVRITHTPSGLVTTCQDERSQFKNKEKALAVLRSRLLAAEIEKQQKEITAVRRSQVGSGDRSERVRTYNFPQGRVTDHRIGLTSYNLEQILDGDLMEFVEALVQEDQARKLENVGT